MPLVRVTLNTRVLDELMEERELRPVDLARALGIDRSAVSRIRSGQAQPSLPVYHALRRLFPDADDLLTEHHEAEVFTDVENASGA